MTFSNLLPKTFRHPPPAGIIINRRENVFINSKNINHSLLDPIFFTFCSTTTTQKCFNEGMLQQNFCSVDVYNLLLFEKLLETFQIFVGETSKANEKTCLAHNQRQTKWSPVTNCLILRKSHKRGWSEWVKSVSLFTLFLMLTVRVLVVIFKVVHGRMKRKQ